MEVVFDTLGAEQGIQVVVEAGCRAHAGFGISVCLVGDTTVVQSCLQSLGMVLQPGIRLVDSRESVGMNESPAAALEQKNNASINVAMRECISGSPAAVVSPGHSGATVLAARNTWGLLPMVKRACLCQRVPCSDGGHFLLSDAGASLNAEADDLCRYGMMTSTAAQLLLGIARPRTGLLNIGHESGKGDPRLVRTHHLMTRQLPGFIGNIEGNRIWQGAADAVITDGLTGNILIKSAEGLAAVFANAVVSIQPPATGTAIRDLLKHFHPADYGGAVLLGVPGVCIVCHGNASTEALVSAARLAAECLRMDLAGAVAAVLSERCTPPDPSTEKGDRQ